MKRVVIGALFLGVLGTCWTASGQVEPSLLQPASVRKTAFEYDSYLRGPNGKDADIPGTTAPSPGGTVAVPEPTSPSGEGGMIAAPVGDPVAADAAEDDAAAQRVPWMLPQPAILSNHGIKAGGWIQQGITFNGDHPADHFNGPQLTNDFSNRYQMNQAWLYCVRPTQTDGCGVDLGGRFDLVYGTDWRFGQCFGLENRINGTGDYGLILPQFYGELAINDLTIKAGHYATFTSYEIVPAPANFFYSHSYLSSGYFDPVLVAGAQADYKVNDNWTAVAGLHRGWQMFEDPGDTLKFLGGFKWASDDKRTSASVMLDAGRQLNLFSGEVNDKNSVIAVVRHQFNDKLSYGSQYTVGYEANANPLNRGESAEWYGTEQVLVYQINAKWSAGVRYEWVRDDDGARVFGIGLLGVPGWTSLWGYAGEFNDFSIGLNWRPLPNLVFRPEARWDWYTGGPNSQGFLPYGGSVKDQQFTLGMDLVWTF